MLPKRFGLIFLGILTIFIFFFTIYTLKNTYEPDEELPKEILIEKIELPKDKDVNIKEKDVNFDIKDIKKEVPSMKIEDILKARPESPFKEPESPISSTTGLKPQSTEKTEEKEAPKEPPKFEEILTFNNTDPSKPCKSVMGRKYNVDDNGHVCSIDHTDRGTRCCKDQRERYICTTCNLYNCCSIYEMCVSCCMNPKNKEIVDSDWNSKKNEQLYRRVKTNFEFCITRCRTSSKSVINENRYRSVFKHCYGRLDPSDVARIEGK